MELEGCHVLVTGGAGFIGSHIADRLLAQGAAVRILDNLSTGHVQNVPRAAEFIEGDIRDEILVARCMRDVDLVFHEAAQINPARAVEDPLLDFDINARGTLVLLLAARAAGVARFIMASTNVYGNVGVNRMSESISTLAEPGSLLSPYAAAKVCAEAYLKVASDELGLPTVRLRYFNVYGPRQRVKSESGVVALLTVNALAGRPLRVYGSGQQTRDFVYVDDVVEANILAARCDQAVGGVFNVGTGRATAINELAELIRGFTNFRSPVVHAGTRAADFNRARADLRLTRAVLGFEPKVELRDGLRRFIDWCRESGMR